jgi:hypothetical protein
VIAASLAAAAWMAQANAGERAARYAADSAYRTSGR